MEYKIKLINEKTKEAVISSFRDLDSEKTYGDSYQQCNQMKLKKSYILKKENNSEDFYDALVKQSGSIVTFSSDALNGQFKVGLLPNGSITLTEAYELVN